MIDEPSIDPSPAAWLGRRPGPSEPADAHLLQGQDRRYLLTATLLEAGSSCSVADLVKHLHSSGFAVGGRPSKTISDALRAEVNRGRVIHRGRGRYEASSRIPRSTRQRIQARARHLHAMASSTTTAA